MSITIEKPVCNVDAEAALLGALLSVNSLIDKAADMLRHEDFYEPLFGRLFAAIVREHSLGRPVSPVTLKSYFIDDPALKEMGGPGYLAQLTGTGGLAIGAMGFARQIAEMARRRRLIDGLNQAAILAADLNASNEEVIAAADAALSGEQENDAGVVQMSGYDAFWEMIEDAKDKSPGVTAPNIPSLTAAMGPARPHHLVILGGRPGMGKTCVAMSYAISAAEAGHGVLFVSLEMSRQQLMQRAAADMIFDGRGGVPYDAIRDDLLSDRARDRVHECGSKLRDLPFHIVDAASLTIGRLNMIVRRYKRRMEAKGTPLSLVVVDYLQLLRPDHRASSPVEAVSEVSRGLKAIAKTHDLAVLGLSQLSRAVEGRENKRPKLSDLRESGQIEQDADAVVFLYRDHYCLKMVGPGSQGEVVWRETLEACENDIEFICAKRRNGEAQTTTGKFFGAYQAVRG